MASAPPLEGSLLGNCFYCFSELPGANFSQQRVLGVCDNTRGNIPACFPKAARNQGFFLQFASLPSDRRVQFERHPLSLGYR